MFVEMMNGSGGGGGGEPSVKTMTTSTYVTGKTATISGLTVGKKYLVIIATAWSNGNFTISNPVVTSGVSQYNEVSRIEHQVTVQSYSRFSEITAEITASSTSITLSFQNGSDSMRWYYWIIEAV